MKIDHWAMMIISKIQELYDDAFVHTRMRQSGYFNKDEIEEFWVREGVTQAEMNEAYRRNELEKTRFLRNHLVECTERVRAGRAEQDPTLVVPEFLMRPMQSMDRGIA